MIMKYYTLRRLASLYPGEWRVNVSAFISSNSIEATSFAGICPSLGRFQCQALNRFGTAVHSFSSEDDFSELGPPVMENSAKQLKLATEKPEPRLGFLRKNNCAHKRRVTKVVQGSSKISRTSRIKLQDRSNNPSLSVTQNHGFKVGSAMTIDQDETRNLDGFCSVSIESIPSTFGLSDLVQAVSIFGKVSCARIRSVPDGLCCCDVEFVDSESCRRAVLAGGVTLESIHLPIRPLDSSYLVTIRIEGIGMETNEWKVHSMCKSSGALEGLEVDGKDAVNAFFRVKNDAQLQIILKRLNSMIVDDHFLSAYQLPSKSSSLVKSRKQDGKSKLGLQFNNRLVELKRQMCRKRIYFEDLQLLHMGIFHLEGLPTNYED